MNDILPKHGVTSTAVSQEDVDLFMDYIIDRKPVKAEIHKKTKSRKMRMYAMLRSILSNQNTNACIRSSAK